MATRTTWILALVFFIVLVAAFIIVGYFKSTVILDTSSFEDFNPLKDEGFQRETEWGELRSHDSLSASAADFKKDQDCRRVVVFFARRTVLGHIFTACDTMEPSMGLLMVDNILYYYGRAMEKEGSGSDEFTIAKKVIGAHKCLMTSYKVKGSESPTVEDTSVPKEVTAEDDVDCSILINFKMPPMLLLSRSSKTGKFKPDEGSTWGMYNPWEALGVATRLYRFGARCFRLLVIMSYSRHLQTVKVSCGPVQGLVMTDTVLYYGNAVMVKRNPSSETFIVIYNPKGSGNCIKNMISLSDKNGSTITSSISKEHLSENDKECKNFVEGKIADAAVDKNHVTALVKKIEDNKLDVEPYGTTLSEYKPYSQWSHFNLPMEIGIAVGYCTKKIDSSFHKLLLVVARGVPIAAIMVKPGPTQHLVIRRNVLYYEKYVMARKISDKDQFTVHIKIDDYSCFKKSYALTTEGGKSVKQELPSWGVVTMSMDEECRNLIQGNQLKPPKAGKFSANTDGYDGPVPATFNEEINISPKTTVR